MERAKEVGKRELSEQVAKLLVENGGPILREAQELMSSMHFDSRQLRSGLRYVKRWWRDLVRPALMALVCEAVGANPEVVKPIARGLILAGAAIDIHDDIVDKTEVKGPYRRRTVLGRHGQSIALILGDALLVQGLMEVSKAYQQGVPSERVGRALEAIRQGLIELGDAEALEQELVGRFDTPPDEYLRVVEKKAADVEAYVKAAAMLAGATEQQVGELANYGRRLGMVVILADDIEDTLNVNELRARIEKEPPPLPLLLYASAHTGQLELPLAQAPTEEEVRALLTKIKQAKSIQKSRAILRKLSREAIDGLKAVERPTKLIKILEEVTALA